MGAGVIVPLAILNPLRASLTSRHPEFGDIVAGVFTPVLTKHTKSLNLIDMLAVGVDRIQRSFEPMRRQVEEWRQEQISEERVKLILYAAFVDGKLRPEDSGSPRSPERHSVLVTFEVPT